jgi:hypothetical protein
VLNKKDGSAAMSHAGGQGVDALNNSAQIALRSPSKERLLHVYDQEDIHALFPLHLPVCPTTLAFSGVNPSASEGHIRRNAGLGSTVASS